jgi:S1-C subfamily serine protease
MEVHRRDRRGGSVLGAVALLSLLFACRPSGAPVGAAAELAAEPPAPVSEPGVPVSLPPAAAAPATELESQVMQVYQTAGRGVVNITRRSWSYDFFLNAVPEEGSGSGFVYDAAGHIVTNYHVVERAQELQVTLADGSVYPANVVGEDPSNDLAVIKIEADRVRLQPIPLGDSRGLAVGRFVIAIGNPFGLGGTLTMGVVSSLGRVIQSQDGRYIGEMIQSDAPINPGNSGGPLIDLQGRVVGVNTAIFSPSGASAGIGFSIPESTLRRVVPELIERGRYPHPWLGIYHYEMSASVAEYLTGYGWKVPPEGGLMVLRVVSGSPADRAGVRGPEREVRVGRIRFPAGADFIRAINGEKVQNFESLTILLETRTRVGDTIQLTIMRGGREMNLRVTLAERPPRLG